MGRRLVEGVFVLVEGSGRRLRGGGEGGGCWRGVLEGVCSAWLVFS